MERRKREEGEGSGTGTGTKENAFKTLFCLGYRIFPKLLLESKSGISFVPVCVPDLSLNLHRKIFAPYEEKIKNCKPFYFQL